MNSISTLLSAYELTQPHRARGGIYALSGFNYQLRFYLYRFIDSLLAGGCNLAQEGGIFIEALSDLAEQRENGALICVQIKRTLTKETLKSAAEEVSAIQKFLEKHDPALASQARFELVASRSEKELQWSDLPVSHPARATINLLLLQERLIAPRIEPDPWWNAVVALWSHLYDPYDFLRYALDKALSRDLSATDAQRIRDDISERFKAHRISHTPPGQILTPEDFKPTAKPGSILEIGREITLARLRDQQYMPRPERLENVFHALLQHKENNLLNLRNEVPVFWLNGRSGVGKSVLLLQAVELLVEQGERVLWLKGQAELLEPALQRIVASPQENRLDFIAIDDLYDRDARETLDLNRLRGFIEEQSDQTWPIILTCGPTEFADAFEVDARHQGFKLHRETVDLISDEEVASIATWYKTRTGKESQRGEAYHQAVEHKNGLFVSLAVELAHGDLKAFALRFAERVRLNNLDKALLLPLSLNRLYLKAPYDWLTEQDREHLATLNTEGDFNFLEDGKDEFDAKIVRLTHPHLADALYCAMRIPSNKESYKNDLAAAFRRALMEKNKALISQLLRTFSSYDGLASERLDILDRSDLAQECAKLWNQNSEALLLDRNGVADAATSWACWAVKEPIIKRILQDNPFNLALLNFKEADKFWSTGWLKLANSYPGNKELMAWASEHLGEPNKISHPTWSLVWDQCIQADFADQTKLQTWGIDWLRRYSRRPDWHFVWQKMLPSSDNASGFDDAVVNLGFQLLYKEKEGPTWAFVFRDLFQYAQNYSNKQKLDELATLANDWLTGRENRSEWTHIFRALLVCHDQLPGEISRKTLLHSGVQWLEGREDRSDWTYVWRVLLEYSAEFPEMGAQDKVMLERGWLWLKGREERNEWAFVWRVLLANRDNLPATIELTSLLELGKGWLEENKERSEWAFIWGDLVENHENFPTTIQLISLLESGQDWLAGNEERPEWAYIWNTLLANRAKLLMPLAKILELGIAWLAGREERTEWSFICQSLLKHSDQLPASASLEALLELSFNWLSGHEDRAEWNFLWQSLLLRMNELPVTITKGTLLNSGYQWLKKKDKDDSWGFICERLLEHQYNSDEFLNIAATWLEKSQNEPSWPLLAAKFILAAPQHSVSACFASELTKRIQAFPNKGQWYKMESLVELLTDTKGLPQTINHWLNELRSRNESPFWDKAKAHLEKVVSVQGTVVYIKNSNTCVVNLGIGLIALWHHRNLKNPPKIGQSHILYIIKIDKTKGVVEVSNDKPHKLEVGQVYEGTIKNLESYGIFIQLGHVTGLLHKTEYPNFIIARVAHPIGSKIHVEVIGWSKKGPLFRFAGTDNITELSDSNSLPVVGKCYEGIITGIESYGLFLRVGSLPGLLHYTSLPQGKIMLTQFKLKQKLLVQVTDISPVGRLSLALPES